MTTTIDLGDARTARALAIAADAGQWVKCRSADGELAYGIPSQRTPGRYYLVTASSCTCEDFKRNGLRSGRVYETGLHTHCKHVRAVQIHEALVRGVQPVPQKHRRLTLVQPAAAQALARR